MGAKEVNIQSKPRFKLEEAPCKCCDRLVADGKHEVARIYDRDLFQKFLDAIVTHLETTEKE